MSLEVLKGDASVIRDRPVILAHVCNDKGYWGAGFSGVIGRNFSKAEREYRKWAKEHSGSLTLGEVQFVEIGDGVYIANMIGQVGIRNSNNRIPLRYEALEKCLETLFDKAAELGALVQMPKIGAGLAGGDWGKIEKMVAFQASKRGVKAVVYSLDDSGLGYI